MRRAPVLLLLALLAILSAAAAPPAKSPRRLDVNGDPLPERAVARLGTVRFQPPDTVGDAGRGRRGWHGYVATVALSPDGKTLAAATGGDQGTLLDFMDAST